jgi:hypothetical protein
MKNLITLLLIASAVACAADITGHWKGTAEGPQGKIERDFNFKQEGTKLTGDTKSDFTGESKITDGKVEGDTVVFTITAKFQDNDVKLTYKGKITGEEITFDVEFGGGGDAPQIKYVAKRVK